LLSEPCVFPFFLPETTNRVAQAATTGLRKLRQKASSGFVASFGRHAGHCMHKQGDSLTYR
jgi:hypothetical protein